MLRSKIHDDNVVKIEMNKWNLNFLYATIAEKW